LFEHVLMFKIWNFYFWIRVKVIKHKTTTLSNPQVKQLLSFNQVYSLKLSIKSLEYLYEIAMGENGVGSKRREREQWISGVRDEALDRSGNGDGLKWPLVKKVTWVILVKQINRINRLSIKISNSLFHWCLNICSNGDMFTTLSTSYSV